VLVIGDFQVARGDRIVQDDTFTLAAGQRLVRDFAFTRRRLAITVLQVDGKTPATALQLNISGEDLFEQATTDSNGVLVLDPAPRGKITIGGPSGRLPPVEIPPGQTEHAVTVTLPK